MCDVGTNFKRMLYVTRSCLWTIYIRFQDYTALVKKSGDFPFFPLQVALLVIYLAILFILTRFMETVIWYEQGQLSRRLLDPMTLSVMHLKAILEQRGVSYSSMVEKRELTELVEATGLLLHTFLNFYFHRKKILSIIT